MQIAGSGRREFSRPATLGEEEEGVGVGRGCERNEKSQAVQRDVASVPEVGGRRRGGLSVNRRLVFRIALLCFPAPATKLVRGCRRGEGRSPRCAG